MSRTTEMKDSYGAMQNKWISGIKRFNSMAGEISATLESTTVPNRFGKDFARDRNEAPCPVRSRGCYRRLHPRSPPQHSRRSPAFIRYGGPEVCRSGGLHGVGPLAPVPPALRAHAATGGFGLDDTEGFGVAVGANGSLPVSTSPFRSPGVLAAAK